MATRQQLRGDGSKEYQIITNLSRGINNAVADDVLVDNAFRDVVNFSSDQLGNISKRDNLLNSNFKEFIRKLAYGDFNLSNFNIKDYLEGDTGATGKYVRNYKRYSYGRVDQILLQNFYEMLFTDKHYIGNPLYATYSGVGKDSAGNYFKVASYSGAPFLETEEADDLDYGNDYDLDIPIVDDTSKLTELDTYTIISQVNTYVNPYKAEVSFVDNEGSLLKIESSSVPSGWTLNEDSTVISKTYDSSFYEEVTVNVLNKNNEIVQMVTSVCVYDGQPLNDYYTICSNLIEGDTYFDCYLGFMIRSTGRAADATGISNDAGWTLVPDYEWLEGSSSHTSDALYKRFNKSDLGHYYTTNGKTITLVGVQGEIPITFEYLSKDVQNIKEPTRYRYNDYIFDVSNMKLKNIYVIEQNNFFKNLQNLNNVFREATYTPLDKDCSFDAYFVMYGDARRTASANSYQESTLPTTNTFNIYGNDGLNGALLNCLYVCRLKIIITKSYDLTVDVICKTLGDDFITNTDFKVSSFNSVRTSNAYVANYKNEDVLNGIFINKYSNYLYVPTGSASVLQMLLVSDDKDLVYVSSIGANNDFKTEDNTLIEKQSNVYYPVPYEVTNPGFNLAADYPLEAIDSTGNVDNIRGIFYTVNSEVVQNVPCNIPFSIHVIVTGASSLSVPKIRPNNGELDEAKNPYKDLPGSWSLVETTRFDCTGIDNIEAYELKITKGDDEYITYVTPTPYVPKDTGGINELSGALFGCPRAKIINSQLVLFGNGGYIYFSDFENFKYFPSYYYVYVANGTDEEIIDIVYFRQFYAIFTNKRILRMSGDFGTDNFEVGPLNDFMGCVNHNTIRQVYNSLYFIGYNGIYALNQGYLGSGTENLKRIDTQLTNTFNFDNVAYCYVMGNIYIIIMKDGKTWYTYDVDNDMFLRYNYSLGDASILSNVSFIETLEENQIYAILATNKEANSYTDDLLLYNFPLTKDANYDYEDSNQGYISAFETPYINLGTPTNTKKFKNLFIKMYNETDSLIPLYITVYVDDILAITPEDYVIELDEETNTYFYYFKADNNAELLKAHNLLGELTLGKDTLGDNIIQQLKLKINTKGRAIKIILADGYDYPNKDNSAIINYRNNKKFSISTIGIVYKLKKVKEG